MKTLKTLNRMGCGAALALAAVLVAAPAFAQFTPTVYKATITMGCKGDVETSSGSEFLPVERTGNREWIARCNELDPSDSNDKAAINEAVATQIVVFDHVDHRLLVIDRCSREEVCSWHFSPNHDEACALSQTADARTTVCANPVGDLQDANLMSIDNIHGTMWCKDTEPPDESLFRNSCSGFIGIFDALDTHDFGTPCQVNVSSAGEYVTPMTCDPPQ